MNDGQGNGRAVRLAAPVRWCTSAAGCVLAAVMLFANSSAGNEKIRITVHAGARQEFGGFGCNGRTWDRSLPDDVRDTLVALIWNDLHFRLFRFYRVYITGWDNAYILSQFRDCVERTVRSVPDMVFLFNPTGTMTDPYSWGERIAEVIDMLQDSLHITIAATGIGNEPNQQEYTWAAPISSASVPAVVRAVRTELDKRGLTGVGIIAPGPSNIDQYMWDAIEALMNDAEALGDLYAWEYHSYNMSIGQGTYDWIAPSGKEIWQTEASLPEGDYEFNDSMCASQTYTRFLADMNFGVKYWAHWYDANIHDNNGPGAKIVAYNEQTGQILPHLKFYYLRQLSRTFVPLTRFRKCTSDLGSRTGRSQDSLIEYTYGLKIPVAAAAGVRPDGSWVMAATNHTGLRFTDYGSSYFAKADYDVTFLVEELADSGDIEFRVWRCNNGTRNVFDSAPALMQGGEVTVTVRHCDLVCLSTSFDTTFVALPEASAVVHGGSFSSCGTGGILAFVPALTFGFSSALRRVRRRNRRKAFNHHACA